MIRRSWFVLAAVACLATAPASAQQPAAAPAPSAEPRTAVQAGPRLDPGFNTYQPQLAERQHAATTAAAADRTVITISTLGLVLLAVLLIVLLT